MLRKIIIIIVSLLSVFSLNAQKGKFITPFDYRQWSTVDDFEFSEVNNWELNADEAKDITTAPRYGAAYYKKINKGVKYKLLKGGRFIKEKKYQKNDACLGVKVCFPEFVSENLNLFPKESYKLKGICSKLAFWVLGREHNVDFDLVLEDYSGTRYYLPITKLNYLGWRFFEIHIPSLIEEYYKFHPKEKILENMKLVGFIVTNYPDPYSPELWAPTYLYIDQIEFFADMYVESYPGKEIKDDW